MKKEADAEGKAAVRRLYIGDNLAVMRGLELESADLIYLDPPFNSKRIYDGNLDPKIGKQSFKDIWTMSDITAEDNWRLRTLCPQAYELIDVLKDSHGESWRAYLTFMAVRLDEMHKLLKPTGSIYLHCDWHMNSPLRLLMDIIFGADNFRNEILWCYTGPSSPGIRQFPRKHDSVLWYAKTSKWTFNREDMRVPYKDPNQTLRKAMDAGRGIGADEVRKYRERGKVIQNWWTDIALAVRSKKENTGWATQKPLALLERIIKASSNKGDTVLDPFCGCATACVAAERLGRQWIGIDQHPAVGGIMEKRIKDDTQLAPEWDGVEIIDARKAANLPRRGGVREIDKKDPKVKKAFYEEQGGGCKSGDFCLTGEGVLPMEVMDFDRVIPGKKGGRYTPENVCLLCRKCNATKGGKGWVEFERAARTQLLRDKMKDRKPPSPNPSG